MSYLSFYSLIYFKGSSVFSRHLTQKSSLPKHIFFHLFGRLTELRFSTHTVLRFLSARHLVLLYRHPRDPWRKRCPCVRSQFLLTETDVSARVGKEDAWLCVYSITNPYSIYRNFRVHSGPWSWVTVSTQGDRPGRQNLWPPTQFALQCTNTSFDSSFTDGKQEK